MPFIYTKYLFRLITYQSMTNLSSFIFKTKLWGNKNELTKTWQPCLALVTLFMEYIWSKVVILIANWVWNMSAQNWELINVFAEDDGGTLTTWSNMVKARGSGGITADLEEKLERGRTRTREENNINNNMDSSRKSRSVLSPPDWSDRSQLQEFAQHLQGEAHNKARLERLRWRGREISPGDSEWRAESYKVVPSTERRQEQLERDLEGRHWRVEWGQRRGAGF